jgi:mannose-6-phosphate isomerase-like protein (cupin superfamily)
MSNPLSILHVKATAAAESRHYGPYAIESLIPPEQECAGTVYRVKIEPHQHTAVSYHKIAEEYYYVLAGAGVAILDGAEYPLSAGDFLRLPPGTKHAFVTGGEPLLMLDIHSPGSRPDRDVYFVGQVPDGFQTTD